MTSLPETFSTKILNEDSEIVKRVDVETAGRLYLKHCRNTWSGVTRIDWKAPDGLLAAQSFPIYSTQFLISVLLSYEPA